LRCAPPRRLAAHVSRRDRGRIGQRRTSFPPPTETLEVEAVVLGGGIAGLAAARQLQRQGVRDLLLLELENETGGNALSGRNAVSAYPWGAHYLPLPNDESTEVIALLEELGVIQGRAADGAPIYDEYALCADPMERLHQHGGWQEGVLPRRDLTADDRRQYDAFFAQMENFRAAHGSDGRRAFSIPVDRSSRDETFRALDRMTMATWLDREGFTSAPLRWYVDYGCRDDYGADSAAVSAWAGIHYFAARNARAANAPANAVLTWPEGNGWLAAKLREPIAAHVRTRSLVCNIEPSDGRRVAVDFVDLSRERTLRVHARGAVCALPRFVAQRLLAPWRDGPPRFPCLEYSPWMVANLTLDALPDGPHAPPAWDNVIRPSPSLGYVVATHQHLTSRPQKTVITYYQPLDDTAPPAAREAALKRTHADWSRAIVDDLARVHPDIAAHIERLDVWLWGHAMIRPSPGFVWGETRQRMLAPLGSVFFAHSDMSGLSLFEEAYTRGVETARALHTHLAQHASS
jgi:phytoene dehydrogenase-like protein